MFEIQPGSKVKMHLRITLPNGTVAEDTFAAEPLEFTMNDGTLIPSLELALYGLREGQEQTLELEPEQGAAVHVVKLVQALGIDGALDGLAVRLAVVKLLDGAGGGRGLAGRLALLI